MITINVNELDRVDDLVKGKNSFTICGAINTMTIAQHVEMIVELNNFKCRVYTANRSAAMASVLIPTGLTQIFGAGTAIGIGVHNLLTWNPDYEIVKDLLNNRVEVIYKK